MQPTTSAFRPWIDQATLPEKTEKSGEFTINWTGTWTEKKKGLVSVNPLTLYFTGGP